MINYVSTFLQVFDLHRVFSHLENFEWKGYGGRREEKQLLTYANSKCLKTVGISLKSTYNNEEKKKKMTEELEGSMYRVSESSQLFFSTQFRWRSMKQHPAYQVV